MTNQYGQKRGVQQEKAYTLRIYEFYRTTEDKKNFIEELKKVIGVIHVADTGRVDPAAYQQKNVARTCFDQWKEGRDEYVPPASWVCFEEAFLG